jgi:hypothetical protein
MPKQKLENDPALIEATARQICEGMGDNPDDMIFIHAQLPKTRSGKIILSEAQKYSAPAWTMYVSSAEAVLRYLLVERIVMVKRDTIDPAVKAKVLAGEPNEDFQLSVRPILDGPGVRGGVMTEDDVGDPVHEALWTIVVNASHNGPPDDIGVRDAVYMLGRVGYLADYNPTTFFMCGYKPAREPVWKVIQFAHSVNGIGSDFMWKARAKLFPDAPASRAKARRDKC